jgi:Holliday junction resolvase
VPGNPRYRTGRNFEYRIIKDLSERGFFTIRAAGSKGVADIVALRFDSLPLLISAKVNGIISPDERGRLVAAAQVCHANPILAERADGRTLRYWLISRDTERKEFYPGRPQ